MVLDNMLLLLLICEFTEHWCQQQTEFTKGDQEQKPMSQPPYKTIQRTKLKQTMFLRIFFKLLSHIRIQPGRPLNIYHTKPLDYLLSDELVVQPGDLV
jgi:hypothetical protein